MICSYHFPVTGAGNPGSGTSPISSLSAGRPACGRASEAVGILERGRPTWTTMATRSPRSPFEQVRALLTELFIRAFNQIVLPTLDAATRNCRREELRWVCELALTAIKTASFLELDGDPRVAAVIQQTFGKMIQALTTCLDKAHQDCVAFKDPFRVWDMVMIARQLELLGVPEV